MRDEAFRGTRARVHAWRTGALAAAVLALTSAALAQQTPMASDLVNFSGGSLTPVLRDAGNGSVREHIVLGTLAWSLRDGVASPISVTLTSRGVRQTLFFDPAPLLDAGPLDGAALRTLLNLAPNEKTLPASDPPGIPRVQSAMRRLAREEMAAYGLVDLDALVKIHACHRQVAASDLASEKGLLKLLACSSKFAPAQAVDVTLLRSLRARGMLSPVLESASMSASLHVAGALVVVSDDDGAAGSVDVFAAAGAAHAEKILGLAVQESPDLLQQDWVKLLVPPLLTFLGIALGAFLGFQAFLRQQPVLFRMFLRQQQRVAQRAEADQFDQRKRDKDEELKSFFKSYVSLRKVGVGVSSEDLWNRVHDGIVYEVLPAKERLRFDALREGADFGDPLALGKAIDALLADSFKDWNT